MTGIKTKTAIDFTFIAQKKVNKKVGWALPTNRDESS
jgi:hypothetical protein